MANRKQINNVCKALTAEQADWIRTFTPQTGFDLWWLDELANKSMPFREFALADAQMLVILSLVAELTPRFPHVT